MTECFQIDKADNVATLLDDVDEAAEVLVRGDGTGSTRAMQHIRAGHKIAVSAIPEGERVIKYGFPIGEATQPIAQGEWVHLHNCRSLYDARSSTLDIDSGSPTETRYV